MFKRIFGQGSGGGGSPGPKPNVTSTARTVDAIQKLGETEELLVKRRTLLEKKIAQELEKAKTYTKAQNKRGELLKLCQHTHAAALMALKKKKMYETQLEQCENNILRVNEQQMMLENQRTTVETVSALRDAAHASKYTMSDMKITDVDQVLDEINEQTDQMQQIQDAMAQPIGPAADVDEDELMGELENLESEQLDDQLLEPAPVPTARPAQPQAQHVQAQAAHAQPQANPPLPSVPHTRPAQAAKPNKSKEEEELEALEREMAV